MHHAVGVTVCHCHFCGCVVSVIIFSQFCAADVDAKSQYCSVVLTQYRNYGSYVLDWLGLIASQCTADTQHYCWGGVSHC